MCTVPRRERSMNFLNSGFLKPKAKRFSHLLLSSLFLHLPSQVECGKEDKISQLHALCKATLPPGQLVQFHDNSEGGYHVLQRRKLRPGMSELEPEDPGFKHHSLGCPVQCTSLWPALPGCALHQKGWRRVLIKRSPQLVQCSTAGTWVSPTPFQRWTFPLWDFSVERILAGYLLRAAADVSPHP